MGIGDIFDLTKIKTEFMISLPVATKRCRLGIYGNWVEIDKITNEEARSYNSIPIKFKINL